MLPTLTYYIFLSSSFSQVKFKVVQCIKEYNQRATTLKGQVSRLRRIEEENSDGDDDEMAGVAKAVAECECYKAMCGVVYCGVQCSFVWCGK